MGDAICILVARSFSRSVGLFAVALSLCVFAGCSDDGPKPGKGLFATRCDEDKDCKSLICAGLDGETKLCSESCTDVVGDECKAGFRCRRPERKEGLVCVCTDPRGCEREGNEPVEQCAFASECDDGVSCTEDQCDDNECSNLVRPFLCAVGSSCDANEGCVENEPCSQDFECSTSGDACRSNAFCDPSAGRCQYELTDNDGDQSFPTECGGNDCDDFDFNVNGDALDFCDGVDNDCDNVFDEDADQVCNGSCTLGSCGCGALDDCSITGGGCVDTDSDPFNCGGCGFVCESGFQCIFGGCRDENECFNNDLCPPSSTCADVVPGFECRCNSGFEPNASLTECIDVDECSRGFHDCPGGSDFCINLFGGFECECGPGFQNFGSGCVDIDECANGFDCAQGFCNNFLGTFECVCDPGYQPNDFDQRCELVNECQAGLLDGHRWCDGSCRDLSNDSSYCGSCSNTCFGSSFCQDAQCTCDDESRTYCGGDCVETQGDINHCGECFNQCASGAGCVNGDCFCPMGQTACGGTCVSLGTTDRCLACDDWCALGATCTGNGCACPGSAPLVCDGQCINPVDNELYCGSCTNSCPEGATCTASECICPASAPNRCENNNVCSDFKTSEDACGQCDSFCEVICNEGECSTAARFALGDGFGCALFGDGRVGCFGNNDSGRLGRGLNVAIASQPLGLLSLTGIASISTRVAHACALDGDGVLRCWGENSAQQLGNGDTTDQLVPVMTRVGVAQVAVGLLHTCVVLQAAGKVECIGSDVSGQRGDGATSPAFGTWSGPSGLPQVDKLVSGANHLCALIDGEVFCWGDNTSGQLGVGTGGAGTGFNAPGAKVSGLSGVSDLAAGLNHTCAIANRQVFCWGENSATQCGSANIADRLFATAIAGISDAVEVTAGDAHTCALRTSGTLVCWGSGVDGQNGRWTTGPALQTIFGPWQHVAAGSAHTCAVASGDFACWGDGLTITNDSDTAEPVRITR